MRKSWEVAVSRTFFDLDHPAIAQKLQLPVVSSSSIAFHNTLSYIPLYSIIFHYILLNITIINTVNTSYSIAALSKSKSKVSVLLQEDPGATEGQAFVRIGVTDPFNRNKPWPSNGRHIWKETLLGAVMSLF